jgi:hypothetical protein
MRAQLPAAGSAVQIAQRSKYIFSSRRVQRGRVMEAADFSRLHGCSRSQWGAPQCGFTPVAMMDEQPISSSVP